MRSTVPTANPPPVCEDKKKTIISVTDYTLSLTFSYSINVNHLEPPFGQLLLPSLSPPVPTAVYSSLQERPFDMP